MRKITRALGMIHPIPDKLYLKLAYRLEFGEKLDLEEPATFNQKLQWIKLNGATFRLATWRTSHKPGNMWKRCWGRNI